MSKPFDSIFKEIFERVVPELVPLLLKIPWGRTEELKDKTQVTEEREADYLKKLTYEDPSSNCIFHAEFHLKDEDLRSWMLFKRGMLRYRHELPVVQVVFYIGPKKRPRMPDVIEEVNLTHRFHVVPLSSLPAEIFLESEVPEMVLLSILADSHGWPPDEFVPRILQRLQDLTARTGHLFQLFRQLEVFSKLRNLQPIVIKNISAMPIEYDLKTDIRYQQGVEQGMELGVEKGIELKTKKMIENLLVDGTLPLEKIAILADVPLEKVLQVQKELAKKKAPPKPKKK